MSFDDSFVEEMEEIGVLVQPELLCLSQGTADPGGALEISLLLLLFGISPSQRVQGLLQPLFYPAPHLNVTSVGGRAQAVREDGAFQGFGDVGRKWFLFMKKATKNNKKPKNKSTKKTPHALNVLVSPTGAV